MAAALMLSDASEEIVGRGTTSVEVDVISTGCAAGFSATGSDGFSLMVAGAGVGALGVTSGATCLGGTICESRMIVPTSLS